MKSTFLCNDRIQLRPVEPDDLDIMYEMENDPLMWDISSFTVPYSRYVLKQYIVATQSDIFADKQLRLIIVRREDNRVLGTIDMTDFEPLHMRAAIGIAIHHKYRKEGYGTDALNLLCSYAFGFLHLHSVYAQISVDNKESIALFSGCGFEQTGLLKQWLRTTDGYTDAVVMQLMSS